MWRGELHLIRTYCPGSLGKVVYLLSAKLNTVVIMSCIFFLILFFPRIKRSTLAAVAQISDTQDLPAPYSKRQHNANMLLGLQCNYNERCRGVAAVQAAKSDWRVEAGSRCPLFKHPSLIDKFHLAKVAAALIPQFSDVAT